MSIIQRAFAGAGTAAVAAAVTLAAGQLSADTFNDTGSGNWEDPATWLEGAAPTSTSDVIHIDEFTVSATGGGSGTFTGGEIHISGSGVLALPNSWSGGAPAPLNIHLDGGTFNGGAGHVYDAGDPGTHQLISVSGESTITHVDTMYVGSAANPTHLTGSGTLIKTSDASGLLFFDAAYTDYSNPSDFSGTLDIRGGMVRVNNPNILKNASVVLGGPGTALSIQHGHVSTDSQGLLQNLAGDGGIHFIGSNYGRDLVIDAGGSFSPGTATTAGSISLDTNTSHHELIFRTDGSSGNSQIEMDIFGASQADADQLVWQDSDDTSTVDFSDADLVVRMFTPTENLGSTSWTLIEADQFGIATNGSDTLATASAIEFSNVTFDADAGWQDLAVSYDYTAGESKVIVTGSYVIPEPSTLALIGLAGVVVLGRRRVRDVGQLA